MLGFKITATYVPDNTVLTPDVGAGAWGDAFQAWAEAIMVTYNGGELATVGPDGANTSGFVDYVDTSDSSGPAIRGVIIWDIGVQDPFDLAAFQAVFESAAASGPAVAAFAAFDSSGSMSYESVYVEQWSDTTT